ncbi:OB-fold nucleic acid binding domain [Macleaya cordata]|uniref:OB-fold nucleic acid binding domain n=1 Tax=Macleaya cordata TaxID=56857 RepID=A0A200R5B5_MACCD|nr:OB-fold nucleic acid binding domain [Macleaya cordata]
MDYSLAALKLLCGQLKNARQTSSQSAMTIDGILFQRAWLQGILVSSSEGGHFFLDDGTGVIELFLSNEFRHRDWKIGMYVMVVGAYVVRTGGDSPMIKVHKMVDLSAFPDREAMWHLEVIEAYKLFYQSSFEE